MNRSDGSRGRVLKALLTGIALQGCWATKAFAQQGQPTAPPTAQPAGQSGNDDNDIVVTAQRREQRLQDVPIAITAISAQQAERQGVRNVDDLQIATPALNISRVNQVPLFYLRGVGTQSQLPSEEVSIPLYVDGFYASTGAGSALSLNNIERVEILRGPQGTLFGRNGTGGLINIVTRTPSQDPHATLSVGYGNYTTIEASFYGSTGLGDAGAVDLALRYVNRLDAFGRNVLLNNDVGVNREFAARSKLLMRPTPTTTVTLTGEYSNIRSDYGMTTQLAPGVLGFDGITRRAGPQDISGNINPITTPRTYAITGRIDQEVGFGRFVSMTQWRDNRTYYQKDVDGIPINRGTAMQHEYTRLFTQELQLQSRPDSRAQWVAGLFYLEASGGVNPLLIGGIQFGATILSQERFGNLDTTSYAGFAQITYPILDTLNVTVGGRYTHDRKVLTGHVFNNLANGTTAVVVSSAQAVNPVTTLSSGRFTYRFALDYHVTPDVLLYGVYSRGYKAGSFNVQAVPDPPVRPETLDAVEVGIKSDLFDRVLRVNVAAYHYDYTDIQLSQLFQGSGTGSGGIKILNASSAEIYGAELEVVLRTSRQLQIGANLAYTHGRYGTFLGAPFSFPLPYNCTTGLPTGPTLGRNAQCTGDATGNQVIRTAPFTSTIFVSYDIPIGNDTLSFSVNWYHNDGFFFEVDNRVRQPAYDTVNADARYTWHNDYSVRVWARNIFNEQYYSGVSTSNNDQTAPGAPRTYGLTLSANF